MSDTVKLMIKIPKEVYEAMKNNVSLNSDQKGMAESIVVHSILSGTILNECESDDITFKDDNAVSRLSVRDIIYANAYELEYPDSSSEYVVNRDELIKYLMELPPTKENLADAEDCISREYLRKSMIEYGWSHPDSTVTEYVESLPSVYPKSETEQELRNTTYLTIKDISKANIDYLSKLKTTYDYETPTTKENLVDADDCRSREFQEIVVEYPPEDLCTYPEYKGKPYFSIKYKKGDDCIIGYGTYNPEVLSKYLRDCFIPSVTPQDPKTGHWIGHREHCENLGVMPSGLGVYEWCSNCDCAIDVREWHRNHYNYCPNCGAKMDKEQIDGQVL